MFKKISSSILTITLLASCHSTVAMKCETQPLKQNLNEDVEVVISVIDDKNKSLIYVKDAGSCPKDMAYVDGMYCRNSKEECEAYLDPEPKDAVHQIRRCSRYKSSVCLDKQLTHMSFCIDKFEYTKDNETLPVVNITFNEAKNLCEVRGKRLCKETEWELAAGGQENYPYTTGLERPVGVCNIDISHNLGKVGHLNDYRVVSGSLSGCVSPYGVYDMNGNVGEVVIRDRSGGKYTNALKSGWFGPVRNRVRAATIVHSNIYSGSESGVRCCK